MSPEARPSPGLPGDVVSVSIAAIADAAALYLGSLAPEERATYDALRIDKRRRDWLAGRIAAKRAVQRLLGLPYSRIAIRTTDGGPQSGRPYVIVLGARDSGPEGYLSISHAADLAVAAYSATPVGLDVERIEPRDESFEALAFPPAERGSWRGLREPERSEAITRAWCLKEAYAKWRGVGFRAAFHDLGPSAAPLDLRSDHGALVFGGVKMAWARVAGATPNTVTLGEADIHGKEIPLR